MVADIDIVKIIPALPGYYVLSVGDDDGSVVLAGQEPILAWALDREFFTATPITQGGIALDAPVLRPDGTVAIAGYDFWMNVVDWMAAKVNTLSIQRKQEGDEVALKQCGGTEAIAELNKFAHTISSRLANTDAALVAAKNGKVAQ